MTKRDTSIDDVPGLAAPIPTRDAPGTLDVAVLGGVLVERRETGAGPELRLFGHLDSKASGLLEAGLTAQLPVFAQLDLTHLDTVEPAALRSLIDRQHADHRDGRELLLRIAPHQVSALGLPGS